MATNLGFFRNIRNAGQQKNRFEPSHIEQNQNI